MFAVGSKSKTAAQKGLPSHWHAVGKMRNSFTDHGHA